ncbi:MAG: phage baseplate assembly protein V [Acidobacteriota bacterium]|nr:phage baseplate assembly protein V [Acidobacteriota bacterium]
MNLFEVLAEERDDGAASRVAGVVVGVVTNNKDEEGLGRVKVKFPWLSDEDESNWARVAAPMAGNGTGVYFLPEVGDEVLVAFEQGDVRFPYVVGALWNGKDAPPEKNDDGKNGVRVIKSRSGHVVRLTDEGGKEKIEIVDKSEQNSVVIDTAKNTITITSGADIVLSAAQGTIRLDAQNVEVKSSANTRIEAGGNLDAKATGLTNVKGATINLN